MPPSLSIAIVESDDLMRQLLLCWLGEAGHRTQAVTVAALQGRPFDLVIADVAGPGGVAALVRRLRGVHAGPLVLMSARFGQERSLPALAEGHGVAGLLTKPFAREQLLAAVQLARRS